MAITYTKENGIYTFFKDNDLVMTFDCKGNILKNRYGKRLKSISPSYWCTDLSATRCLQLIINNIAKNNYLEAIKLLSVFESCMAYPNINTNFEDLPDEFPKGYAKYCEDNHLTFCSETLSTFKTEKLKNSLPADVIALLEITKTADDTVGKRIKANINYLINSKEFDYLIAVNKMLKVSIKENIWNLEHDLSEILAMICRVHNTPEHNAYFNALDTNRSMAHNTTQCKIMQEDLKNQTILTREKQIDFLKTIDFGDFVVKVPQKMIDFTNEGKQQNNCVGYHYHDSIRDGRNLIYFLRKKANPEKSYVTCRYNISKKATIEFLKKNNRGVTDNSTIETINEIDKLITEKLAMSA